MEKINTNPAETAAEGTERLLESVDRAHDFYEALKEFDGTDVVGADALEEVEGLALHLKETLQEIPPHIRLAEGLPCHPHDLMQEAA